MLASAWSKPAASPQGVLNQQQAWSSDVATFGSACSALLQLPDDLLTSVARLAGKATECRSVCGRLRNAYGPPGHTVKQPTTGFEVELVTNFRDHCGYLASVPELQRDILQQVYKQHGSPFMLAAVRSCSERWPDWAGQVTRQELSDTYSPDAPALRLISEALPNLQELVLAVSPPWSGDPTPMSPLPQLVHLTQLCLLCSSHSLLMADRYISHRHSPFSLLPATPSLRSLHLDLRHLRVNSSVLPWLQPLQHLTHLELVFGPEGDILDDNQYLAAVRMALASLADRLQSLVFLSPVECLGEGATLPTLQSLTRLTSLGWCIGWIGSDGEGIYVDADTDWLQLPASVRQLVLGYAKPMPADMHQEAAADLADAIAGSQVAVPALQSLVLPTLVADEPSQAAQSQRVLCGMLSSVAGRCPGLTSLRCGLGIGFDDEYVPVSCQWLQPVGRLKQLQQLVLVINDHELDTLGCLAGLPQLSELWLHLEWPGNLLPRLQHDPDLPAWQRARASGAAKAVRLPRGC